MLEELGFLEQVAKFRLYWLTAIMPSRLRFSPPTKKLLSAVMFFTVQVIGIFYRPLQYKRFVGYQVSETGGFIRGVFYSEDYIFAIALLSDGDVVAVGRTVTNDIAVLRFDVATNGWDSAFGAGGLKVIHIAGIDYGTSVGIDSSGKIVVGGSSTFATRDFILLRLNPADGSLDTTFDGDGIAITSISASTTDEIEAIAFQPDGRIVVSGFGDTGANGADFVVARYNPNGSLDTSFDFDGVQVTTFQ